VFPHSFWFHTFSHKIEFKKMLTCVFIIRYNQFFIADFQLWIKVFQKWLKIHSSLVHFGYLLLVFTELIKRSKWRVWNVRKVEKQSESIVLKLLVKAVQEKTSRPYYSLKKLYRSINNRCPMVSTDQADLSCFYFRISWILMERCWFYFFVPSIYCRASEVTT
jgi:hypothetical protein